MKAYEHRAIGDEATAGAKVDVAPSRSGGRFLLSHGDVIALSGDFFGADELFELASVPGASGVLTGTSDEVVCALKVMAVDEAVEDPRFGTGGEFATYQFSPQAARTDVERRVRDRFLARAARNEDHFLAPWGDSYTGVSARTTYRRLHQAALDEACRLGGTGGDLCVAMAREAAAQHYLTDAFASGHVRTPIGAIREYWHERYPRFWECLRGKIASDTAAALRELAVPLRLVRRRTLHDRTLAAIHDRTEAYPPLSLGDLLGRVFHDWDNDHGLRLENGQMLFGDGHLDNGIGRELAVAAVRAGNDDVEIAYGLGAAGRTSLGEPLYAAVRDATGAGPVAYTAESLLPRLSAHNRPLNWRAGDVDELWTSPIAGTTGPTVGEAVAAVLDEDGEVFRRLDCLGQGIVEAFDVVNVPILKAWLGRKACHAYHRGFLLGLARDPRAAVAAVVEQAGRTPDRSVTWPALAGHPS
ncbi:MAG TPA: hypothetical protein VF045_04730 [Acidimicrobiales bacterium]